MATQLLHGQQSSHTSYWLLLRHVCPYSSVGEHSTCNAGVRGSIPREGNSYAAAAAASNVPGLLSGYVMLMWSMGRGELARGAHWMLLALMRAPAQL